MVILNMLKLKKGGIVVVQSDFYHSLLLPQKQGISAATEINRRTERQVQKPLRPTAE